MEKNIYLKLYGIAVGSRGPIKYVPFVMDLLLISYNFIS